LKLEEATLSLEPRSVGACIDLAILFYRRNASRILALSALFGAVPVLIGALRAPSGDGWLWACLSFFYLSPFLGATLVAGVGHHVFGEAFTLKNALKHFLSRIGALALLLPLASTALAAVGAMCWGVLWVPMAARFGFLSEVVTLERLHGLRIGKRIGEILRHHFVEACGRYVAILGFASALSIALFLTVDVGSQVLFGVPLLLAKVSRAMAFQDFYNLLSYDPLLIAALAASWWVVYPLARLAWFFCYLDARIRKEGWDVEIQFRVEARRIA
jgi:hypothetical protein